MLRSDEEEILDEVDDEGYYSNDDQPYDDDDDDDDDDDGYDDAFDDAYNDGQFVEVNGSVSELTVCENDERTKDSDKLFAADPNSPPKDGSWIPPPLPLLDFPDDDAIAYGAHTGLGYEIPEALDGNLYDARANIRGELHDTTRARERARYCAECELREAAATATSMSITTSDYSSADTAAVARRSGIEKEYLVFDCDRISDPVRPREGAGAGWEGPPGCREESLHFNSRFESGNLFQANRVISAKVAGLAKGASFSGPGSDLMECVDHEYDLFCQVDTATAGNIQWFYFSVQNNTSQKNLTIRLNIVNMMKKDSLYNYGMKPCVYSLKDNQGLTATGRGWLRGGSSIAYHRNRRTYTKKSSQNRRHYYTLTFTYTFEHADDVVFFAHCYPFTYSDLQRDLKLLEENPSAHKIMRRRQLCRTIAGNRCEMITVTAFNEDVAVLRSRAAVVISARVHPGETNASFMMRGVIRFLTSDNPTAATLREHFVFKLVPMMNPDGVINGNYRTDLMGQDLNRRYARPTSTMQPTVYAIKELLRETHDTRGVFLYVDLHGHSRKKNIFLYGCDELQSRKLIPQSSICAKIKVKKGVEEAAADIRHLIPEPPNTSIFAHVWPYLLYSLWPFDKAAQDPFEEHLHSISAHACAPTPTDSKLNIPVSPLKISRRAQFAKQASSPTDSEISAASPLTHFFSYRDSNFKVSRSKYGTGRVVAWRELGIRNAFTLESTFCGMGDNREQSTRSPDSPRANSSRTTPVSPRSVSPRAIPESPRPGESTNTSDKVECHYSARDLEDVGQHICESLLFYCNLLPTQAQITDAGQRFEADESNDEAASRQSDVYSDEDEELFQSKPKIPRAAQNCDSAVAAAHKRSRIDVISDTSDITSPIVTGTLFDPFLAKMAARAGCLRAQTEVYIRTKMRRAAERCLLSLRAHYQAGGNVSQMVISDEEDDDVEGEDNGSDSDPSGDNLSKKELMKSSVWKSLMNQGLVEQKKIEKKARKKSKGKRHGKKSGEVKAKGTDNLVIVEKATSKTKSSKESNGESAMSRVLAQRSKDAARAKFTRNLAEVLSSMTDPVPRSMPNAPSPKVSSIQLQMEVPSPKHNPRRDQISGASRRTFQAPLNGGLGFPPQRSSSMKAAAALQSQQILEGMEVFSQSKDNTFLNTIGDDNFDVQEPRRSNINRMRSGRTRASTTDAVPEPEPVSPLVNPKKSLDGKSLASCFPPLTAGARASNEVVQPWEWSFNPDMTLQEYMDPINMPRGRDARLEFMGAMSPRISEPRPRPPANPRYFGSNPFTGHSTTQQEPVEYRPYLQDHASKNMNRDARKDPLVSLRRSVGRHRNKATYVLPQKGTGGAWDPNPRVNTL